MAISEDRSTCGEDGGPGPGPGEERSRVSFLRISVETERKTVHSEASIAVFIHKRGWLLRIFEASSDIGGNPCVESFFLPCIEIWCLKARVWRSGGERQGNRYGYGGTVHYAQKNRHRSRYAR